LTRCAARSFFGYLNGRLGLVLGVDMQNRFFLWLYCDASPVQIALEDVPPGLPATDVRYFLGILQHLDQLLHGEGLTFVLTWHLDAFQEAMEDAVLIMVGDERYQTPSYQRRVRAIFKTGGVRRNPLRETLRLPASIAWRALLLEARNSLTGIQRRWQYGPPGQPVTPMCELPLGYFALRDIDPPTIDQRPVDVFFAGSLKVSGWTMRASVTARQQMAAALAEARAVLPQYRIESLLTAPTFGKRLGPEAYTLALASAKIALAPRGSFDETFRLFEAAKLGCVIVSEPLPQRWYYQGCPVVSIPKWSALPGVLRGLLNDPTTLKELSRRGRQWWDSTISEEAVANFIAQRLVSTGSVYPKVGKNRSV
jgi:hypothetical protein